MIELDPMFNLCKAVEWLGLLSQKIAQTLARRDSFPLVASLFRSFVCSADAVRPTTWAVMDNFDDFENKSYVAAEKVNYSTTDYLVFLWNFSILTVQAILILLFDTFIGFIKLFHPDKPKDISGQLALVTGLQMKCWIESEWLTDDRLPTGGANGLGKAIAHRLAKEKCNIVIVDLNLNEAVRTAAEIAEKFNVKAIAFKVDVSDFEAIQKLKSDIEASLGFVEILVNNAGILSAISLREGEPSSLQKVIDVNLTSHFWVIPSSYATI